eukprot:634102-Prorocentrum_minimum.AAC.12
MGSWGPLVPPLPVEKRCGNQPRALTTPPGARPFARLYDTQNVQRVTVCTRVQYFRRLLACQAYRSGISWHSDPSGSRPRLPGDGDRRIAGERTARDCSRLRQRRPAPVCGTLCILTRAILRAPQILGGQASSAPAPPTALAAA